MQEEKPRRGRKKKDDQDKKKTFPIYVTDKELATIKKKADNAHMDVSPFIVSTVLRKGK